MNILLILLQTCPYTYIKKTYVCILNVFFIYVYGQVSAIKNLYYYNITVVVKINSFQCQGHGKFVQRLEYLRITLR